jgi:glycosyltransferase involved in cell wall biosynthesis
LGDWYAAADVFVLSSRFEGFPNALVEAMAHGVPAISFDCDTGPRDIIRGGRGGVLVPPEDSDALAGALRMLFSDIGMRQRLSAEALEVRKRFSIDYVCGQWERLFSELGVW